MGREHEVPGTPHVDREHATTRPVSHAVIGTPTLAGSTAVPGTRWWS